MKYKIVNCVVKHFDSATTLTSEHARSDYEGLEFSNIAELKAFIESEMARRISEDEFCDYFLNSARIRAPFKNALCKRHERKTGFLLHETGKKGMHHVVMYSFTIKQIAH